MSVNPVDPSRAADVTVNPSTVDPDNDEVDFGLKAGSQFLS